MNPTAVSKRVLVLLTSIGGVLGPVGCTEGGGEAGCDQSVAPSDDDQTALATAFIEAEPGSTICLAAGEYSLTRELSLNAENIVVRGAGQDETILDFSGQVSGGNGIKIVGDHTTFEDLHVKNTPGDGIRADDVDGITFRRVTVSWDTPMSMDNGAYGLYPVLSSNVRIQESKVIGARDAGIYVGQSNNVLVEDCEAHGNVAGIEIENTTDAIVRRNRAFENTAGILVFNLPGLDVRDGKRANVYDNDIENNNIANFGDPGTVVGLVPPGVGVLVLASDFNEIGNNRIVGNDSAGVAIIHYYSVLFGMVNDPQYDLYAEGNWIHDNEMQDNGNMPADLVLLLNGARNPSPSIIVDGCYDEAKDDSDGSLTNCFSDNRGEVTYLDADLCEQVGAQSEDIGPVTCTREPLPTEPMAEM